MNKSIRLFRTCFHPQQLQNLQESEHNVEQIHHVWNSSVQSVSFCVQVLELMSTSV